MVAGGFEPLNHHLSLILVVATHSLPSPMLHVHPKYQEVAAACESFPEEAATLFQVYLDLTLEKEWAWVKAKEIGGVAKVVLEGKKGLEEEKQFIVPTSTSEPWSIERLEELFDEFQRAIGDKPSSVMLAITSSDSTVVYYRVYSGIVPPNP
ncbi:hypothetical protein K493DRAFT_41856 [Basidiobolus meristosporus CBS 931.73]|uniref:tRNA-splicing endonuclease subunit Sen15 domain-containing protein n=1 Tax=Basidiobolus meristosporus CBS 931.73 TaxID=1314790 RepID=A0A1Y1Y3R9_9FUNG|nr:hypothetical protein K493DRAFT_41856 [Basidiobolus meristosporus CBS 931.73]|eukprot:ORX92633.1 hypothetical protein K493DRAFT_41856 [Basidiobolus meristosporus CBS 931.73]